MSNCSATACREQRSTEPHLIDLAYAQSLPLVATNEPFFATPDDYEAHDALICIAEGRVVAETDRRQLTPEHYFKTRAEMAALFADLPEAIANTVEIAQRCAFRPRTDAADPAALHDAVTPTRAPNCASARRRGLSARSRCTASRAGCIAGRLSTRGSPSSSMSSSA